MCRRWLLSAYRCFRRSIGAGRGAVRARFPYWYHDPSSTSSSTSASSRSWPPAMTHARRASRAHRCSATGPRPPAVGALPHPRSPRRPACALTKMHHAAVDGMSGAEILSSCSTPHRKGHPARRDRDTGRPQSARSARDARPRPRRHPRTAVRSCAGCHAHCRTSTKPRHEASPQLNRRGPSPRASRQRPRTSDGGHRRLEPRPLPRALSTARSAPPPRVAFTHKSLDEVKQIKNHFGVTVNDVVVSVCAGAPRGLQDRGDSRQTAARDDPGLAAHRGAARHLRRPRRHDEHADPHRRSRSRRAPCAQHEALRSPRNATGPSPHRSCRTPPTSFHPHSSPAPRESACRWQQLASRSGTS